MECHSCLMLRYIIMLYRQTLCFDRKPWSLVRVSCCLLKSSFWWFELQLCSVMEWLFAVEAESYLVCSTFCHVQSILYLIKRAWWHVTVTVYYVILFNPFMISCCPLKNASCAVHSIFIFFDSTGVLFRLHAILIKSYSILFCCHVFI